MPARGLLVRENWRLLNTPAPQKITTSAVQAKSAALGSYEILLSVDVDTYIREDTDAALTATPVSSSNGHFVPAGSSWTLIVDPGNKIGAISANGSLYISALG
jgi:hypothetical protein